ncbi:DNA strand exchange inhibitor protein [Bacillus cereus group sp. BceL297]|uniref:DNA strand exchange inhibitor protein n=1 Tax=unclassified Bacillus cereus group TaxID=2750818 RepID=UPI003F23B51A
MEKDQANVYTSHVTNTTSESSLPKKDKQFELEITNLIRAVLNDVKIKFKMQKVQVKQDVREKGISKKQEILQQTENRLQTILSQAKETIQQGIQRIQIQPEKEDAVVVEIAESNEIDEEKNEQ